jgi:hypothetical protein
MKGKSETATIAADGTSTQVITVQARDVNNNNRTTGGSTVVFSATSGTLTCSGFVTPGSSIIMRSLPES